MNFQKEIDRKVVLLLLSHSYNFPHKFRVRVICINYLKFPTLILDIAVIFFAKFNDIDIFNCVNLLKMYLKNFIVYG